MMSVYGLLRSVYVHRLWIKMINRWWTYMDLRSEPNMINDIETQLFMDIRKWFCNPGAAPSLAVKSIRKPYDNEMRNVNTCYLSNLEIVYFYTDSLTVLNMWNLYNYPLGQELSEELLKMCKMLQDSLKNYPYNVGRWYLYIHLCEISCTLVKALQAREMLRTMYVLYFDPLFPLLVCS